MKKQFSTSQVHTVSPDLAIKRKSCDFELLFAGKIWRLRVALFFEKTCDFWTWPKMQKSLRFSSNYCHFFAIFSFEFEILALFIAILALWHRILWKIFLLALFALLCETFCAFWAQASGDTVTNAILSLCSLYSTLNIWFDPFRSP